MQQRYGSFYRIANVYRFLFHLPLQQRHSRVGGNPLIHLKFRSLIYVNVLFSGLLRKLLMMKSGNQLIFKMPAFWHSVRDAMSVEKHYVTTICMP